MKIHRRLLGLVLSAAMLLSMSAYAATYSDVPDTNAANQAVERWSAQGVIQGANGKFRPSEGITRADMAVILNRIMQYQSTTSNTFSDLPAGAYYTDAVLKLNAAGIMQGANGLCRPKDNISRQEAIVMLARVLEISGGGVPVYADAASIGSWASDAVGSFASQGYLNHMIGPDQKFKPTQPITRAEVVQTLDLAIKGAFLTTATYNTAVSGTAIVSAPNAQLSNMHISGNLIITEGASSGTTTLNNVTVTGDTIVQGGRLTATGTSQLGIVELRKANGLTVDGDASLTEAQVKSGTVALTGKIPTLTMSGSSERVTIEDGTLTTINMHASNSSLSLTGKTTVNTLSVFGSGATLSASSGVSINNFNNTAGANDSSIKAAMNGADGSSFTIREGGTYKDKTYESVTIHADVGDDTVKLDGVTIKGDLTIKGGGSKSVILCGGTTVKGDTIVDKSGGQTPRLLLQDKVTLDNVYVKSDANLQCQNSAKFKTITSSSGATLTLTDADAAKVIASGPVKVLDSSNITTLAVSDDVTIDTSKVTSLTLNKGCDTVSLEGNSTVSTLYVDADNTDYPTIDFTKSGSKRPTVSKMYVNARDGARLSGTGYVNALNAKNENNVSVASGVTNSSGSKIRIGDDTSTSDDDDRYTIKFRAEDSHGTLTAYNEDTKAWLDTGDEVEYGDDIIFYADPDNGYVVSEWTGDDAKSSWKQKEEVTLTVKDDIEVYVSFEDDDENCTITFRAEDSHGTLTAYDDNRRKWITSGDEVEYGTQITFYAKPDKGYRVYEWSGADAKSSWDTDEEVTLVVRDDVKVYVSFH